MADEFARDMIRLANITNEKGANPRVVAIVCAAYIENHITGLIRKKMPGLTPAVTKALFDPTSGHLATVASKIDMAVALQVISEHVADDARLIARIRNEFAHKLEVNSFDHNRVRGKIDNLAGAAAALRANWSREAIFRAAALGLCNRIMAGHVENPPYSFTMEPENGALPPLHTISVPGPHPQEEEGDPEDQ